MSNKVNIPVLAVSLALIAGIAAALLGWIYQLTKEPIAAAEKEKTEAALLEVISGFDTLDKPVTNDTVVFYTGRDSNSNIVGFAGQFVTTQGYNGEVTVLAGLTPDGTITTVLVTKQSETPGLGTVVCERKRQKTISKIIKGVEETGLPPNAILDQYSGMNVAPGDAEWKVKKDGGSCDAITGATITSRAICGAVYKIAATFTAQRDALIGERVEVTE